MSLRDLICELRSGKPEPEKTGRWLRYAGFGCLAAVVWNVAMSHFFHEETARLPMPPHFDAGLLALAVVGILFILSGKGVLAGDSRAVPRGQMAIVLLVGLLGAFTYWIIGVPERMGFGRSIDPRGWFLVVWAVAGGIVFLQFAVPGFFALQYLQRLKSALDTEAMHGRPPHAAAPQIKVGNRSGCCHALVPFGVHATFLATIGSGVLLALSLSKLFGSDIWPIFFVPVFGLLFLGPIFYNFLPSTFQQGRKVLHQATGGGSIFFLKGSWPFFKLLVYADGIELRFFLHAWLIPYDKLDSVSLDRFFLSRGLVICSNLPGVPSRIRFHGFGNKALLARIQECMQQRG